MTTTHTACTYDKIEEERLVEKHLPLVHSCARKLWHEGLDYDDLIQLGSIGLIKAIRRFDKTLGNMLIYPTIRPCQPMPYRLFAEK